MNKKLKLVADLKAFLFMLIDPFIRIKIIFVDNHETNSRLT